LIKEIELSEQNPNTSTGLQENIAGLLCYLIVWITGIIFLIIEKDNKFVRFHAWQSIIVFGALTLISIIFGFIPVIGTIISWLAGVLMFVLWIVLMYKAYKGELYKLPIAGVIAEKQTHKAG
jgi:uncharacterized membrane protein